MKTSLPSILILFSTVCRCSLATELPATDKPNIVYILADDLGYGDVKCLGGDRSKISTPNIDKLAKQGMTFQDAHGSSSVCSPTRYGILTGRYNWRSRLQQGVLDNYVEPLIAKERLTVPQLLKNNGYHTACFGKWHLGFTIENADKKAAKGEGAGAPIGAITKDGPISRGFDEFFGFHHARMMKSVFTNDRVSELVEPVDMLPKLAKHTSDFIGGRASKSQPFFLYFALNSPHTPIVPSKEWQGKSGINDYADFVMETDWAVGQLLDALDKAGVAQNTLVIFTSDNGCSPAAKIPQLENMGHHPSADRRGHKADIFEGGHRIPFIARWPGKVKPDSTSNQVICLTDLMATCAEILGAELPETAGEDSISILPALLGKADKPLRDAIVHHSINGSFAIRQGEWKLELCSGSGGWSEPKPNSKEAKQLPPIQLYDLNKDAGEKTNVAKEHPEIVERLTKLLTKYVDDGRSTPGKPQKNDATIKLVK